MTGHPLMFAQNLERRRRTVRPGDRFRIYQARNLVPGRKPRWILEAFSHDPHEQVMVPDVVRQPRSGKYGIEHVNVLVHDRPRAHLRFGSWREAVTALNDIHDHLAVQARLALSRSSR